MKIACTEKEFTEAWEGDGMRPGDNIRSMSWIGQLVTIELTEKERKDPPLVQAAKEQDRRQELSTTPEDVEKAIKDRYAHITWCKAWSKFYHQVQDGWYVGTDYAPPDRPEIYDDLGNFVCFLPEEILPGNFDKLKPIVAEAFEEL